MKLAYNTFLQSRRGLKRDLRLAEAVGSDQALVNTESGSSLASELPDLPKMLSVLSDHERHALVLCLALVNRYMVMGDFKGL